MGSDTTAVRVTVLDVNDCEPTFVQEVYRVAINENLPSGSSVASVRALDCDEGANAELSYSIVAGDLGVFQLDCEKLITQFGLDISCLHACSDIWSDHDSDTT